MKRSKQTHTRVAEVEKKLDSIFNLLQANRASQTADDPSPMPESSSGSDRSNSRAMQSPLVVSASPSSMPSQQPSSGVGVVPPLEPAKGTWRDLISLERAQELLNVYRRDWGCFPFVYVPPHVSAAIVGNERPFLFQAILYMASHYDLDTQVQLDNQLRDLLSSKVILSGEISFDVLQGLLVYLG